MDDAWIQHPTGIWSRPLPDRWPALDIDHGFTPPFAVDAWDMGAVETVAVFPSIVEAAREASRIVRVGWHALHPVDAGGWHAYRAEITDQDRRTV